MPGQMIDGLDRWVDICVALAVIANVPFSDAGVTSGLMASFLVASTYRAWKAVRDQACPDSSSSHFAAPPPGSVHVRCSCPVHSAHLCSFHWFIFFRGGISCGIKDLSSLTRFPTPCHLQGKGRVLTTGIPGKSLSSFECACCTCILLPCAPLLCSIFLDIGSPPTFSPF